jgi:hypothetical protein
MTTSSGRRQAGPGPASDQPPVPEPTFAERARDCRVRSRPRHSGSPGVRHALPHNIVVSRLLRVGQWSRSLAQFRDRSHLRLHIQISRRIQWRDGCPSPDSYFHTGGDECDVKEWETNPGIQEFMRAHSTKDDAALQALFTARIQKIVTRPQENHDGMKSYKAAEVDLSEEPLHSPALTACGGHEGRWQTRFFGKTSSDIPALKPYRGKLAVPNFRGGDGNVGIIRSPVRAIALPDNRHVGVSSGKLGGMLALSVRQPCHTTTYAQFATFCLSCRSDWKDSCRVECIFGLFQ